MNTHTDRQNITLARLMAETYEAWVRRFCQERKIPWRDEYGVPLDHPREEKRDGAKMERKRA